MSYRPDDQSLDDRCTVAVAALEEIRKAIMKRLESSDWTKEHYEELCELLLGSISPLQIKLAQLARKTW